MTGWTLTCKLCEARPAAVSIVDDSGEELWVCDECHDELFDARTLQERVVSEIDIQIQHHEEEGNEPAVRSLQHIKDIMLNNCKEVVRI